MDHPVYFAHISALVLFFFVVGNVPIGAISVHFFNVCQVHTSIIN